jgi:thiaminase (transcriptional activator TenA)
MSLSSQLWSDNADVAADVLAHPFVRGIGDGSLPRDLFARYIAQDAFFLESFARAYALALARSQDTATLLTLADLLTVSGRSWGCMPHTPTPGVSRWRV